MPGKSLKKVILSWKSLENHSQISVRTLYGQPLFATNAEDGQKDKLLCSYYVDCCHELYDECCIVSAANSVYMYDAPPPYPGIDPSLSAYPPPPQVNGHYPPPPAAATAPYPDGPQSAAAGMLDCW